MKTMLTKRTLGWIALSLTTLFFVVMLTSVRWIVKERYGQSSPILESEGGITYISPARPIADFTLTASTGQRVSLSDYHGKTAVIAFGYTHCPDVCPLTLMDFARIHQALGQHADHINFVFISVDGERDTPERLARYLETRQVSGTVTALSGDEGEIRRIGVDYGLYFEKNYNSGSQANYLVDHTASYFIVNGQQALEAIVSFGTPSETVVSYLQNS